jgi:peptidoglycan/xylan/chitin deacetylase (PgdA/CDA1 family)
MIYKTIENRLKFQYPFLTALNAILFRTLRSAEGVIFMLHRVAEHENNKLHVNEHLKISPSFLERLILKYIKRGCVFVSLDDVYEHVIKQKKITKPFICFTLDDGYVDNYEIAYPLFKKYSIPFTVYLTSGFPNHTAILWWYILEDLILKNDILKISTGEILDCSSELRKNQSFLTIRDRIIQLKHDNLEMNLHDLLSNYSFDCFEEVKKLSMSWEQVSEINKDPLCTVGGHSVNHLAFNTLNEQELQFEVIENIRQIEANTGEPVYHFAYPYGSIHEVGGREYEMMKSFEFKTVTRSYGGCVNNRNKKLTAMPRIFLGDLY